MPWLLLVALLMLVLFITGSSLPAPLDPAAVALGGAVATLFISHHSGLKPVDDLLASILLPTACCPNRLWHQLTGANRELNAVAAQEGYG